MAALAFGPKGTHLVTGGTDGKVRLHAGDTAEVLHTFEAQNHFLHAVAFAPVGGRFASGCDDGTYTVFDAQTRTRVKRWQHTDVPTSRRVVSDLAFTRDGGTLLSADADGVLHAWDPATGTERYRLGSHEGSAIAARFDAAEARLASGGSDDVVMIWDVATRKRLQRLEGHTDSVYAVAWHPTRPVLASGSADGTVRLWDTRTWTTVQRLQVTKETVYAVAFSDDGTRLAVACSSGRLRVYAPEVAAK